MSELDRCIFCQDSLEDYEYGRAVSNGDAAEESYRIKICKYCAKELKKILFALEKEKENE